MNILMVTPEMVPYAKTGGLADVAGALPKALAAKGQDVSVVMPCYRGIVEKFKLESTGIKLNVPILDGWTAKDQEVEVLLHKLEGSVKVYLVKYDPYFNREFLYMSPEGDYPDNAARYYLFCRAALELIKQLKVKPDVIHVHDWQASLVPILLRTAFKDDPFYQGIKTVLTIHNMGYQGILWRWDMKLFGIDWEYFTPECLEFYGNVNLLKGAIILSDAVNTVSQGYAREIQTEQYGMGLQGVLSDKADDLYGIVNGIDYSIWHPATDKKIPANYSPSDLSGKAKCKADLQKTFDLPLKPRIPLIGCISRLDVQKGFDLIEQVFEELMQRDLQFVLLGTGDKKYERMFEQIGKKYPKRTGIKIAYNDELAHRIEAGSDMFLMPSAYEPCGLNQLISLKYGTIPIVRATGGLDDTITDYDPKTGQGNGFKFSSYSSEALKSTIDRALSIYKETEQWKKLVQKAMAQDHSWEASAVKYIELYQQALEK